MNFEHYVAGKTIAIVGPAPLPYDQSAEIDAHDLVYRPGKIPGGPEYGTRVDIVYLNGRVGREVLDDSAADLRAYNEQATWWVNKKDNAPQRPQGFQRLAHRPVNVTNPNAVTGMLWDLTHFHPASITVYGADLYAGGPNNAYHPAYDRRDSIDEANAYLLHKPMEQLRAHRAIYATGLIKGDDRYVAAVTMTDAEYQAVIDSWREAAQTLT